MVVLKVDLRRPEQAQAEQRERGRVAVTQRRRHPGRPRTEPEHLIFYISTNLIGTKIVNR